MRLALSCYLQQRWQSLLRQFGSVFMAVLRAAVVLVLGSSASTASSAALLAGCIGEGV
jgi:hypothetical protein